jgi:hypothetical protein
MEGKIMAETMPMEPTASEAADLRVQIEKAFTEMELLRQQMRRDHADIERSHARTEAMLRELDEILQSLKRC